MLNGTLLPRAAKIDQKIELAKLFGRFFTFSSDFFILNQPFPTKKGGHPP